MTLIGNVVIVSLWLMQIAIIVRFVLSFVDPTGHWGFTMIVRGITEPILAPIRRMLPSMGMMDLSPMIAFICIYILQTIFQRVWPA